MQRNENIRKKIGVACITDKIREARLRWYEHVERSGDTNIRRRMKSEVQGLRSRGRQKKRWMDMIQGDLKFLNLKPDDTGRRDMWRQRIGVAALELCAGVFVSAAARRSISIGGGGAPPVQKNRRRRGAARRG